MFSPVCEVYVYTISTLKYIDGKLLSKYCLKYLSEFIYETLTGKDIRVPFNKTIHVANNLPMF